MDNATSCQVVRSSSPSIASSVCSSCSRCSIALSSTGPSVTGSAETGIIVPSAPHNIGGGGGKGLSFPWGASGGTSTRYGYRLRISSRTGRVKSMNASSIDAFSASSDAL